MRLSSLRAEASRTSTGWTDAAPAQRAPPASLPCASRASLGTMGGAQPPGLEDHTSLLFPVSRERDLSVLVPSRKDPIKRMWFLGADSAYGEGRRARPRPSPPSPPRFPNPLSGERGSGAPLSPRGSQPPCCRVKLRWGGPHTLSPPVLGRGQSGVSAALPAQKPSLRKETCKQGEELTG